MTTPEASTDCQEQLVIARRRMFSSAHYYKQEKFSDAENRRVFGRCYTPYGHGHNYQLEAFVQGIIDSKTRLVMNLFDLDRILKQVVEPIDHQHLNFDIPEFRSKIPTTENIASYLLEKLTVALKSEFPQLRLQRIRLYETDDLWVEMVA